MCTVNDGIRREIRRTQNKRSLVPEDTNDRQSVTNDPKLGGLAANVLRAEAAEVVELRAADLAGLHEVDLGDAGAVDREDTLDANAVRHLADRERLVHAGSLAGDHDSLKVLNTLFFALNDLHGHVQRVASPELGDVAAEMAATDRSNYLFHYNSLSIGTRKTPKSGEKFQIGIFGEWLSLKWCQKLSF